MNFRSFFQRARRRFESLDPGLRWLVAAAFVAWSLLLAGSIVLLSALWKSSGVFPGAPFGQPSRLYGAIPRHAIGGDLSPEEMVAELKVARYREAASGWLPPGTYRRTGDGVAVHLRPFPTPEGRTGAARVEVEFEGRRIAGLRVAGQPAEGIALEPPLLASFYDADLIERRPVRLGELPDLAVKAVLAAEDDGFFSHPGISPTGIVRALWSNLRGHRLQGASTITQQLVKNLYLSHRRTLSRKAKEALIAEMVELRHSKQAILEAYLNEIYLGSSGSANLLGLGAAARAYFGKDAAELNLEEAATLAGMIQAPGDHSPFRHPQRALERRNWVLKRMADLGWISPSRAQHAMARPLRVNPERVEPRPIAPYFAEVARAEAEKRFGIGELDGKGYLLFSTLRAKDQAQAEAAVARGLAGLEKGWERRHRTKEALQAALVSIDPHEGDLLAWVGGRDYAQSQFDRVAQARRQAGSAFKPVIYAAAFTEGSVSPATLLNDSPIAVQVGTANWQPQNYDRTFHGWVTARTALEQSFNIPAVRVALQVGLSRVVELARGLGFSGDLEPRPSLALGALETNPLELAQVYATFATGGARSPVHGLVAVLDAEGKAVPGEELPAPHWALPPQAAYLVTSALQGVVDHGTGAGARAAGLGTNLAGKTGTTNDRRDSWFAGYSPDRVTVVWVGYDDNSPTHLSGARAALPIWSTFTAAVRPARGYPAFAVPAGLVTAAIDPTTGQLATPYCPRQVTEVFPEWQVPAEPCVHQAPGFGQATYADLKAGEAGGDLAATNEPRYAITNDGLQVLDPGEEGTVVFREVQEFQVPSLPDGGMLPNRPEAPPAAGTILIRPRAPSPPPPAAEPPPSPH